METQKASGLGRGLAGILGDALSTVRAPEVSHLLGVRSNPEVRRLVTELALNALAEGFAASGVVVVTRPRLTAPQTGPATATVASRLPAGWSGLDAEGFEVAGRLWQALDDPQLGFEQFPLDGQHLLICRQESVLGPLVAAMVRRAPFDQSEQSLIARLVRSVAFAVSGGQEIPGVASIQVSAEPAADGVLAAVRLAGPSGHRHASAVGPDQVGAVAAAAVELCDQSLRVAFAGSTRVQAQIVSVVVVTDGRGPLFGLSVTAPSSNTGIVEAVFSAGAVAGADPFGPVLGS